VDTLTLVVLSAFRVRAYVIMRELELESRLELVRSALG
jgi:hypothetical protein